MKLFNSTVVGALAACASAALGVTIDLVTIGNPGNVSEHRDGRDLGGVSYTYQIGKFEVTAAQYTQFLNAVASVQDTYGLYNPGMQTAEKGPHIERSGSPGYYSYAVAANWANRPVNTITWTKAVRFCNWLTNGQPSGLQDLSTTEDGSYYLNGANDDWSLMAVERKPDARWVLPTENEWYKAAYFDPDKLGGAGYWTFATRSDLAPSNAYSSTGTNNANWRFNDYTIGPPYYRTEVGFFAQSPSAYGTFDQNGNVFEWNETAFPTPWGGSQARWYRGQRGGDYAGGGHMASYADVRAEPTSSGYGIGFRAALVPEPAALSLLAAAGGLALLLRRKPRG